ncbi:MAG: GAF domain-containing protein, partial [Pseudomonadota bacterium]
MIAASLSRPPRNEHSVPHKVLLVSSQWSRLTVLERLLAQQGHRVTCSCSVEDATAAIENDGVDVALVDLDLAEFDGLTLIGHLWHADPDLPILSFGGDSRPVKPAAAISAGVSAHFAWPPDPSALVLATQVSATQRLGKPYRLARRLMATTSSITLQANTSADCMDFLDKALEVLVRHFEADRGSVFSRVETATGIMLRAQASRGIERAFLQDVAPGDKVTGKVYHTGLAQLFIDSARTQPGYESCNTINGLSSSMSVPMRTPDEMLGVINLATCDPDRAFTPRDLEALEFLAGNVAEALRHVEAAGQQSALRQQLQNAERLTVAGELTAGITHEIKSPLAYVQTNIAAMRDYITGVRPLIEVVLQAHDAGTLPAAMEQALSVDDARDLMDDALPLITECQGGIQRIMTIIQDLRSMMQCEGELTFDDVVLSEVLQQSVKLTRSRVSPVAKVQVECPADAVLHGHSVQLVQLLVNL